MVISLSSFEGIQNVNTIETRVEMQKLYEDKIKQAPLPQKKKQKKHNIIQIHNNIMWDWQCSTKCSRIFSTFKLLVPQNIVKKKLDKLVLTTYSPPSINVTPISVNSL